MPLDLRAHPLDQPVVAYAGRTCRHAGHAAQAAIPVGDHLVRQAIRRAEAIADQDDASPWRVGFGGPERVGGAGVKTETAVDAVLDDVELWRSVLVEYRHSDLPYEHAGAADAGRVKAGLDPPHQLERRRVGCAAPRIEGLPQGRRRVVQYRAGAGG